MDEAVGNAAAEPILVRPGERLGAVAVDSSVPAVAGSGVYDVVFVGTDSGRVIKFVTVPDAADSTGRKRKTIVIEEIKVCFCSNETLYNRY